MFSFFHPLYHIVPHFCATLCHISNIIPNQEPVCNVYHHYITLNHHLCHIMAHMAYVSKSQIFLIYNDIPLLIHFLNIFSVFNSLFQYIIYNKIIHIHHIVWIFLFLKYFLVFYSLFQFIIYNNVIQI